MPIPQEAPDGAWEPDERALTAPDPEPVPAEPGPDACEDAEDDDAR